jgi:hypothetical protein
LNQEQIYQKEITDENDFLKSQYVPSSPFKITRKLTIAGILLILAGIMGLISSVISINIDVTNPMYTNWIQLLTNSTGLSYNQAVDQIKSMLYICGAVQMILSIFAILGGVFAIQRKNRIVVLMGGILGIFTIGPIFMISTILSIIAIFLVVTSKGEFQKN